MFYFDMLYLLMKKFQFCNNLYGEKKTYDSSLRFYKCSEVGNIDKATVNDIKNKTNK